MSLDDVETPALIVDLDAYERNLDRMAALLASKPVRLRPHAKTHKSPLVAREQLARGAVGACCQKISEAEIMVAGGIDDVLISNEVVGAAKIARVAALARRARIGVCVDDEGNARDLGAAATRAGSIVDILVEIEVGGERCGVEPGGAAVELARIVASTSGLRFRGLQAYHGGAQHIRDIGARRVAIARAADLTRTTVAALADAGLECATVAGGGTGSLAIDLELGVLNELQAGSYIFMDADYDRVGRAPGEAYRFENSLFVLSTVMSVPRTGVAIVDAGLKALAFDSGPPRIVAPAGVAYAGPSDEHGNLALEDGVALALGARLLLVPGHCDPTVNLYDWFVGYRGERVERVWPVAARGASA
jgi:D-serine deaminase-like pyridoxal phosphate-dependent protein